MLFQRIYGESQEFIDSVAERAVGSFSAEQVNLPKQIEAMSAFIKETYASGGNSPDEMVSQSLAVEKRVLESIKKTIDDLEAAGQLSHGISNLLEGVADKHETFVYLLSRRNNGSNE